MANAATLFLPTSARLMEALRRLPSRVEMVLGFAVIGIIFLLVIPIPAPVMDALIAFNLCLSALLISLSLYVTGITAFSTFPVVLLLSTLLRLGISVATTRLILLEGHAGAIVDTFGNFVVGGNVVVGLVVFLIVTMVQFLVITKGAERVAEVSARFCLDAMPAKQLAIENELRSGFIDQIEAKRLRGLLSTESQLLGAMDGALKFVKGDAIAGIVIVIINLVGGLAVGIFLKDMPAGDAITHYTVQTIGDGLVAQIPALLTCMTSAILVTRVDSSARAGAPTFGADLFAQLGGQSKAMWGVAAVMVAFALVPGMPPLAFGFLAACSGGAAFYLTRKEKATASVKEKEAAGKQPADATVVHEFTQMEALLVLLPQAIKDMAATQDLCGLVKQVRNRLVKEAGMSMPVIQVKYRDGALDDSMEFQVYEVPVMRLPARPTHQVVTGRHAAAAAATPGAHIEAGIGVAGGDVVWLSPEAVAAASEDVRARAVSWQIYVAERVQQKLLRYGPRFTGVQTAQKYLLWMEGWMPELAKELQKSVSSAKLADVAQRLLREGISIRNMRLVMETVADVGQRERDPAVLAEFVRYALRDQICHQLAPAGRLDVFVLSPELEETLSQNIRQGASGGFLALSPYEISRIADAISAVVSRHQEHGRTPVLVCAPDVRRYVRTMLEPDLPELTVLSVSELTPEFAVSVVATIALDA